MSLYKDTDGVIASNGLAASGSLSAAPGFVSHSTATGLTAAGTTIADALALTAAFNQVGTVASGTGVKLPAAAPVGAEVIVQNLGANNLEVYPPDTSGVINGASAGGAITLAAATDDVGRFVRTATNNWIATVAAGPAT